MVWADEEMLLVVYLISGRSSVARPHSRHSVPSRIPTEYIAFYPCVICVRVAPCRGMLLDSDGVGTPADGDSFALS